MSLTSSIVADHQSGAGYRSIQNRRDNFRNRNHFTGYSCPQTSKMSYVQITQTFTQHNLLTLPREIRDDIYLAVLQSPSEPPQSPEDAGPRFAGFGSDLERGNNVFYPTAVYPRYACQSLQACNHQMNIEVRELLDRHDTSQRGLDFKLDLMIHHCDIWPTWTLLPGPIAHIRNLGG